MDLGKCTCSFTLMHFPVGALPEVQNHFPKQFSHNVIYNYCSKFLVFSKTDLSDVGGYFHIGALKFGILVHMIALKSPRGRTGDVCDITHFGPGLLLVELIREGSALQRPQQACLDIIRKLYL